MLVGMVSLFEMSSIIKVSHFTAALELVAFFVIFTYPRYVASPPDEAIDLDTMLLLVFFPKWIILAPLS